MYILLNHDAFDAPDSNLCLLGFQLLLNLRCLESTVLRLVSL